jgi:hypothetical protein
MLIRLAPGRAAALEAPEDFKRFKLVASPGLAGAALGQALGEAGRLEGEHAWIAPAWLQRASGLGQRAEWLEGFNRMMEFAAKHGWVNEQGEIRAHIERE